MTLMVGAGVALASASEATFNWTGFLSAMGSNVTFQSRNVFSKKIMSKNKVRLSGFLPGFMLAPVLQADTGSWRSGRPRSAGYGPCHLITCACCSEQDCQADMWLRTGLAARSLSAGFPVSSSWEVHQTIRIMSHPAPDQINSTSTHSCPGGHPCWLALCVLSLPVPRGMIAGNSAQTRSRTTAQGLVALPSLTLCPCLAFSRQP